MKNSKPKNRPQFSVSAKHIDNNRTNQMGMLNVDGYNVRHRYMAESENTENTRKKEKCAAARTMIEPSDRRTNQATNQPTNQPTKRSVRK